MRLADHLSTYHAMCEEWLEANAPTLSLASIQTGRDAWTIAFRAGVTQHAYDLARDINDAHIQTALERIFPNAVFKDAKRY